MAQEIQAKEPGFFSVVGKALKDAVILGLAGAALSAIGAGIGSAVFGSEAVLKAINFFGTVGGSGIGGALATAGMLGGIGGAVAGLPVGTALGISEIKHYYHDVEIPKVQAVSLAKGKQVGAQLEAQAQEYEQAGAQMREKIQSRGDSFVNAQAAEALNQAARIGR